MRWIAKALVQAALARVPYGESINHQLQRMRGYDEELPLNVSRLQHMVKVVSDFGLDVRGSEIVEVGTGWTPTLPIGLCLLGGTVHTYDHVAHLRPAAIDQVLKYYKGIGWLDAIDPTRMRYKAPADAGATGLENETIDLFFSIAVLEHVPLAGIRAIFREAHRVLKPAGLTYHHIGLHDHFANFDSTISVLNFLKFGDRTWNILGQNKIQYHNRLRASDFDRLLAEFGFAILSAERKVSALPNMRVAGRFSSYSPEDLGTYSLTVCGRKS